MYVMLTNRSGMPMKALFLRALFALATSLAAAPLARAQSVSIGIVGGLNASTLADFRDVGPGTLQRLPGLLAGVSVEVPIAGRVSLQPEIIYTQKSARIQGPAAPGTTPPPTVTQRFDS